MNSSKPSLAEVATQVRTEAMVHTVVFRKRLPALKVRRFHREAAENLGVDERLQSNNQANAEALPN
jgi:hypothetical protein